MGNNKKKSLGTNSKRIHILYMEDEAGLARLFQKRLEMVGFKVDIARNGEEGLAMYDPSIHDIIVVDYKMPIYNGLELLQLLAARYELPPAIMLTGSGDERTAVAAMKLGVKDYIVKDMKRHYLDILPSVIEKVLDRQNLAGHQGQTFLPTEREQRMMTETLRWAGSVILNNTLNYDEVLDQLVEQVSRVTPYDAVCILLIKGDYAYVSRWRGYARFESDTLMATRSFKISETPHLKAVLESGLAVPVPYVEAEDSWIQSSGQYWINSYVAVPINDGFLSYQTVDEKKKIVGFLNVESATPGFFDQIRAERLEAFANQAAIALKNARLYNQARYDIAERMKILKREHSFISAILDTAAALVVITNTKGQILRFNRACEQISGYSFDEIRGKCIWELSPILEEAQEIQQHLEDLRQGKLTIGEYESRLITKTGEYCLITWSNTVLRNSTGNVEYIISTGIDITERKKMEEALRESEERYALIALSANDGLWDWDLKTREFYFSPRWKAMLGYQDHQIGTNPLEWFSRIHPNDFPQLQENIIAHLEGQPKPFHNEHRLLHRNGTYRWVLSQGLAVRGADWQAYRMAGSLTDITHRKIAQERLMHTALHDGLTDLPNRTLFMKRLERSIEHAKEDENYLFAVLFLDLDRFKVINDSLGHLAGDQLLVVVARRLERSLRPQDMVARFGGDEFAMLLDGIEDIHEATQIANRIQNMMSQPVNLGEHQIFTTVSIGIASSEVGYDWPQDILRDADTTLYQAKSQGRARYELFNVDMRTDVVAVWELESELRRAVENQEFEIYYQPIVSLATGQITRVEALLRWIHSERGMILPSEFIPLAEETGLISTIGVWVLQTVCTQIQTWQVAGYTSLRVAINISSYQLQQSPTFDPYLDERKALPQLIKKVIKEHKISAETLELEITETTVTLSDRTTLTVLNDLREMGLRIAIDDFGLSSSLNALRQLPLDTLKIDQSFIKDILQKNGNEVFITAIIAMAHALGLTVVAEGVETETQLQFLKDQQCDELQGHLFSPPLPAQDLTQLLQKQTKQQQPYLLLASDEE